MLEDVDHKDMTADDQSEDERPPATWWHASLPALVFGVRQRKEVKVHWVDITTPVRRRYGEGRSAPSSPGLYYEQLERPWTGSTPCVFFARVVERRSFTLAAQDLAVPRSTATEVVKQMEARLGVRLLQRTTRYVAPTLDGDAYYRLTQELAALSSAQGR